METPADETETPEALEERAAPVAPPEVPEPQGESPVAPDRSQEAEERLLQALVEAHATALADPSDLLRYVDAEDVKEDGWPSYEAIVAAAERLAEERPHLARRSYATVPQGVQSQPVEESAVDAFSALLRGAAS